MAETTIGALSVRISADTRGLKRGMKETETALQRGRKSLNKNAANFAKWGAAGIAASAGIAAAIFKNQATIIDSLAKTSDKLGIATENLAGLRFAAEQTGVATGTLDKALLKMTVGIAEATQGTGLAKDAIDELGLSAEDLSRQTPDQALNTIADAMQNVEKQTDKVRIAYDLFGARGVGLINTLNGGSEALKGFQKEAEELGIALTRVDAAKVEQANDALNRASKIIEGALQQATVALAPLVTALAGEFTNAAKEAGNMGDSVTGALDDVIDSVGFVLDAADGVSRVFEVWGKTIAVTVLGMGLSFDKIGQALWETIGARIEDVIELWNKLPFTDEIEFTAFDNMLKVTQEQIDATALAIDIGMADIAETLARPLPSEALKASVSEARAAAEELAKITAANAVGGEDSAEGGGSSLPGLEEETRLRLEALTARATAEQELKAEGFAFDAEAFATSLLTKQELEDFNNEVNEQKQQDHKDRIAEIDRVAASVQMQQAATALSAVATLVSLGGKKSEKAVRAISIAMAIIKGHESAVAAYAAGMATGGPAAPATAALYTAASIAQTGMMIAKLKGGSKSSSRPSGSIPVASSRGADNGRGGIDGGQQRRFDITLVGSTFNADQVRELMEAIGEQHSDGVEFNVL